MKLITIRFRCNLCGEFHTLGVTEKQPKNPTAICEDCVREALGHLDHHQQTKDTTPT